MIARRNLRVERPQIRKALSATGQHDSLFYRVLGERIMLEPDGRGVMMAVEAEADGRAIVDAVTHEAGTGRLEAISVSMVPGHVFVPTRSLSPVQADEVIRKLREDHRVRFASPTYRTRAGNHSITLIGRMNARFRRGAPQADIDSVLEAFGLTVLRRPMPDSGYFTYRLQYPRGADPLTIPQRLAEHPLVEWASPAFFADYKPARVPSDPYFGLQFHLKSTIFNGSVPVDINVAPAWSVTTGSGIRVAILDDGVDVLHGNTGSGFTGDLIGRFAGALSIDKFSMSGEGALTPCCNDTHGTSVAGIIGATHNNGVGGAGVAPGATFNVARIFRHSHPPQFGLRKQDSMWLYVATEDLRWPRFDGHLVMLPGAAAVRTGLD